MASRQLTNFIFVFIFFISPNIFAVTTWLPEKGEYFVGTGVSYVIGYASEIKHQINKYYNLQAKVNAALIEKHNFLLNKKLPQEDIKQRVEKIDEFVENTRKKQKKLCIEYNETSKNFYIEKGIAYNYSLGVNVNYGSTVNFKNSSSDFSNLNLFIKRKIYENKKWIFSGQFGFLIEDHNADIKPVMVLNAANIKTYKSGKKLITEMNISSNLHHNTLLTQELKETLQFKSGYSLQISTYYKYERAIDRGYKYYYRDQLSFAKEFNNDSIFSFPDKTVLTLGFYQEYFHKKRKNAGSGVYLGAWLRI